MAQLYTLENGLKTVIYNMPETRSVSIGVWVKVGSRYEDEHEHGITHFVEHLVFKGTGKRNSSFAIANEIERVGGYFNAETCKEYTGYFVKLPCQYFTVAIDILYDIIFNSLLREEDIVSEGNVVLEEISTYTDTPSDYIFDLLCEVMWPNQALGRIELGSEESIRGITREQIIEYMKRYYQPSNMVITVAGNIADKTALTEISSRFLNKKARDPVKLKDAFTWQKNPEVIVHKKKTDEAHLCLGLRTIPVIHPGIYTLKIIDILTGKGMSSRLFQELRDKRGLAYNVSSQTSLFMDTGAFIIYAGVTVSRVVESIEVIMKELQNIKNGTVTPDELHCAKEFYKGYLSLELEDTLVMAEWLGKNMILKNEIPVMEDIFNKIDTVQLENITDFTGECFTGKNLNLAVIGPFEKNFDFNQYLVL